MDSVMNGAAATWAWIAANREGLIALAALLSPLVAALALYTAPKVQLAVARIQNDQAIKQLEIQRMKIKADLLMSINTKEIDMLREVSVEFLSASWQVYTANLLRKEFNNPETNSMFSKAADRRSAARYNLLILLDKSSEEERECSEIINIAKLDAEIQDHSLHEIDQINKINAAIRARQRAVVAKIMEV